MIEIEVEMDSDVLAAEAVNNTVSSFYQLIMKESEVKIPLIFSQENIAQQIEQIMELENLEEVGT